MTDVPEWLLAGHAALPEGTVVGTDFTLKDFETREYLAEDTCPGKYPDAKNSLTPARPRSTRAYRLARKSAEHPTLRVYKYPPALDNPGRVSAGAARDLRNRAEVHHQGSHAEIVSALRSMSGRKEATTMDRNTAKRARKADRS